MDLLLNICVKKLDFGKLLLTDENEFQVLMGTRNTIGDLTASDITLKTLWKRKYQEEGHHLLGFDVSTKTR